MKKGKVVEKSGLQEGELQLINNYARKPLGEDEVFVFSVALCDNEVDRDFERFTVESLETLSKLFVGKTGILDHNPTAENQSARIISCKVENVAGKKNSQGDDYFRLVARAYMPKTETNKNLRELIDGGIISEVSVGCAVEKTVCSICGRELGDCEHRKGESYGSKLCCGELIKPYDAYEFSFVAIPAQREAGVIKAHRKEKSMTEVLKAIENSEAVTLSKNDSKRLCDYINGLKKQAADGALYRNSLVADVLKFSAIVQPEISRKTMESVTNVLTIEELKEFRAAFNKKLDENIPPKPQLYFEKKESSKDNNTEFKI